MLAFKNIFSKAQGGYNCAWCNILDKIHWNLFWKIMKNCICLETPLFSGLIEFSGLLLDILIVYCRSVIGWLNPVRSKVVNKFWKDKKHIRPSVRVTTPHPKQNIACLQKKKKKKYMSCKYEIWKKDYVPYYQCFYFLGGGGKFARLGN